MSYSYQGRFRENEQNVEQWRQVNHDAKEQEGYREEHMSRWADVLCHQG